MSTLDIFPGWKSTQFDLACLELQGCRSASISFAFSKDMAGVETGAETKIERPTPTVVFVKWEIFFCSYWLGWDF